MTGQTPIEAAILRRVRARNPLSCEPEGIDLELSARNVLIGPNGSGSPVLNVVGDDRRELQRDDVEPDRSILSQRKEPDQYPELAYLSKFYEGINLYGSWEFGRSAGIRDAQRSDVRPSPLTENLSNLGMFLNRLAPYPSAKARLTAHLTELYEGVTDFGLYFDPSTVQLLFTEGDYSIPASRLSDGSLRYLFLLAALLDPEPPGRRGRQSHAGSETLATTAGRTATPGAYPPGSCRGQTVAQPGRAGVRAANRKGGATLASVTVAPTNDRFLRGGQPFFYLGDTAWMAFSNVSRAMWTEYVRYRREQGFTALQISVLPINHDTSVAATNDSPFAPRDGGWDYGARNDAYFDKAERMVAEAVAAGLVPVLGVLWRNYVPGTRSSTANPVAGPMPFDVMEQYVAHIARRFRPYEPMFFISGDTLWESRDEPRYYLRALELIRAGCPDALVSMHLTPQADLPDQFLEAVDFFMFQSGHDADHVDRPWRLAEKFASYRIRRPVINSEPCYEGHGRGVGRARQVRGQWTRSEVRAAAWQSLLSGAKAGVTYGGHGVWSFHTREKRFLNDHKYVPMDWWEALRLPGAWDYGYARWLFETFGLADLAPNQALVANADTAIRAAAGAGVVAVYMPHAVSLEVNADLSRHRITLLDLERRRHYCTDVTVSGGCTRLQLPNTNSDMLLIALRAD